MRRLLQGIRLFQSQVFPACQSKFEQLASGQRPPTLLITCSDSRVVPELIRNGRVPTPGIGIIAASESVATRLGVEGVVIVRTAPGSPAERTGLRGVDPASSALGDVIVEANGSAVRRLSDLTEAIEQVGVGKSIRLAVERNGQRRTVEVPIIDIGRSG